MPVLIQAINVIIDQLTGPYRTCDWLNLDDHPDGFRFAAHVNDLSAPVAKPRGWTYEGSISQAPSRTALQDQHKLTWLETRGNLDVYWDPVNQRETFVGRTRHRHACQLLEAKPRAGFDQSRRGTEQWNERKPGKPKLLACLGWWAACCLGWWMLLTFS